ncbi:hypothetical protein [uncultured Caulobacter sp.]|uniref:hypothetical protein n=1 Tax=uncultured Caulobacter sp. TaxID=158749 RepID=UPI00260ECCAE|nr:hypothetical protein [uncultured Caulobacter sp.]
MKRRIAFAALGFAALLAGCAHEKAGLDGYHWAYLEAGAEGPRLAYGRPDSDDVVLMFTCQPGRDQVSVWAEAPGKELVLASGRIESRFPGAHVEDEMSETGHLEAHGKASAPALAAFKRSGELTLVTQGERHGLTADGVDRGRVRAFFRACGV